MLRPLRDRIVVRPIERVKSQVIDVIMDELPNIRFGGAEDYLSHFRFEIDGEEYLVMSWKDVCFVEANDAKNH